MQVSFSHVIERRNDRSLLCNAKLRLSSRIGHRCMSARCHRLRAPGALSLPWAPGWRSFGELMQIHFGCTQCGKCCRDTKVPLTVSEAIKWLNRGDEVQLLCEASPWPLALDGEPRAAHFKHRSFPVMSGSMPARVVVMLVANVVGACPNLLPDMRCGIYEDRPLVCRIYPAEINPFVALEPGNKACPPEAWTQNQPLFQRGEVLVDKVSRDDIEMSRAADVLDADFKQRLCLALKLADTALVHEAALVYSPTAKTLLSAMAIATAAGTRQEPAAQWRFVSDQQKTLETLAKSGGVAFHPGGAGAASFQYFRLKREAIFGLNPE
jgi:Fe-S-cluster containining protein